MPRKKRIIYHNAWYHVMNRGAGRRYVIEEENENKETFLELLGATYIKYRFEIHAYCLMDNHYHLLVRTPEANLAQSMRYLMSMYSRIYNIKHNSDGPLFRDRYKSNIIFTDSQLLQTCKYIHRNPLEAKFSCGLNYKWSSFDYYVNPMEKPNWLQTDVILSNFNSINTTQKLYNWHLESNDENFKRFYKEHETENFSVMKEFDDNSILSINEHRYSLEDIANELCDSLNITISIFRSSIKGRINHYKTIFILIAVNIYHFTTIEVSEYLDYKDTSFVNKVNVRVRKVFDRNRVNSLIKVRHNAQYVIKSMVEEYKMIFLIT